MYLPEKGSLALHRVPDWFHDAKLGIFIHWGLYSIPAFAVTEFGDITQTMQRGLEFHFRNNPYAEWYLNSLRIEGSPTRAYHQEHYGSRPYSSFVEEFNDSLQNWDPDAWAEFFKNCGARYVVLTTKHHDGFLLYPSAHPNPFLPNYHAARDIPLELKNALQERGLCFGTYYSGALDWTFGEYAIHDLVDLLSNGPDSQAYADYAEAHFRELIERYDPAVLWNDIGYPPAGNPLTIMAEYYNHNEAGLVNDRWSVSGKGFRRLIQWRLLRRALNKLALRMISSGKSSPGGAHYDFRTPEYQQMVQATGYKWEACQGLGYSFGFNRMDTAETYLSSEKLIHLLIDIVSKNGNLLINVGPDDRAQIPAAQEERLLALGAWLARTGEAIYGTRPWLKAEAHTTTGLPLRFTQKDGALYVILLGTAPASFTVEGIQLQGAPAAGTRLDDGSPVVLGAAGNGVRFETVSPCAAPAAVIKVEPVDAIQPLP